MSESPNSLFDSIEVPFPPSITVDELIKKHIQKGTVDVNRVSNAFFIYRNAYNREAMKLGFMLKDVSRLAGSAWKSEPEYVKEHYKRMETEIKSRLRMMFPFRFKNDQNKKSIRKKHRKITDSTTDRVNQNPTVISVPFLKTADINSQINIKNLNDSTDSFMASIPEELALTYVAIMQSLPF
ncbi:11025_t:CDS:1 [Acaulospora colombiana]|uniref:11025_t:CDS:1 n=1 Tax=Acaulospora colombiana TaxID=27376 RepID=A0ACA9KIF1_9GLOM|nr:11025_t:CDS:1 [Acaulospora colombiana]